MRQFVKWNVVILALAASLVWATGAYADTITESWTLSGTDVSGSGWVTATQVSGGKYLVTGISGNLYITYNGTTTGGSIQSFSQFPGTPGSTTTATDSTGFVYDDLLFPNSKSQLDVYGLDFFVNGLGEVDLCKGCQAPTGSYYVWDDANLGIGNKDGDYDTSGNALDASQASFWVPEPSVMGLLSLGLVGFMLALGTKRLRIC